MTSASQAPELPGRQVKGAPQDLAELPKAGLISGSATAGLHGSFMGATSPRLRCGRKEKTSTNHTNRTNVATHLGPWAAVLYFTAKPTKSAKVDSEQGSAMRRAPGLLAILAVKTTLASAVAESPA